jgi:hypothetical protein
MPLLDCQMLSASSPVLSCPMPHRHCYHRNFRKGNEGGEPQGGGLQGREVDVGAAASLTRHVRQLRRFMCGQPLLWQHCIFVVAAVVALLDREFGVDARLSMRIALF